MSDVDESGDMQSMVGSQILDSMHQTKQPGNQFIDNKQEVNDAYGSLMGTIKSEKKPPIGIKNKLNTNNLMLNLK